MVFQTQGKLRGLTPGITRNQIRELPIAPTARGNSATPVLDRDHSWLAIARFRTVSLTSAHFAEVPDGKV